MTEKGDNCQWTTAQYSVTVGIRGSEIEEA